MADDTTKVVVRRNWRFKTQLREEYATPRALAAVSTPGVYVEEVAKSASQITLPPPGLVAFVGRAWRGPINQPVRVRNFTEYSQIFGGLWSQSTLSYAVYQFFVNGGHAAYVVRVARMEGLGAATAATMDIGNFFTLSASSPGSWGRNLTVSLDHSIEDPNEFTIIVRDDAERRLDDAKRGGSGLSETFVRLSLDPVDENFVTRVLQEKSKLIRVISAGTELPPAKSNVQPDPESGSDGAEIGSEDVVGISAELAQAGVYALTKCEDFAVLCIPPFTPHTRDNGVEPTWRRAAAFCRSRDAFLIIDAPHGLAPNLAPIAATQYRAIDRAFCAAYYPWIRCIDPDLLGDVREFPPCGAVAAVFSRSDHTRGVSGAPAGSHYPLQGVASLALSGTAEDVSPAEITELHKLGINVIHKDQSSQYLLWGARTLAGGELDDAPEWKFIPVRRLASYIQLSLEKALTWTAFEPHGNDLLARVRETATEFMLALLRARALVGGQPHEAFFVRCDETTHTTLDVAAGIVVLDVGFAALKPAEFHILRLRLQALDPDDA